MNIGLTHTVISSSSSTVAVNCLPQLQQNDSVVSSPSSSTPVATVSVVECITTNSSVVTSISGQDISRITITSGL